MTFPLHPDMALLATLLGTWSGPGQGDYPTIEPFEYEETVTFTHVGKPFLAYSQRSRNVHTGVPLHGESGYWRRAAPDRVELVVAHPTGIVEVAEGPIQDGTIRLRSTAMASTSTAKDVSAVEHGLHAGR